MMFPEDALYDYDKKYEDENNHGKSISDVLIEAKESVSKPIGEIFNDFKIENEEDKVEEPKVEEKTIDESKNVEPSTISELLSSEDEVSFPFVKDEEEKDEKTEEPIKDNSICESIYTTDFDSIINPALIGEDKPSEEKKEEVEIKPEFVEEEKEDEEETMMDLFKRLGLSEIMFVESELSDLINLEDKEIVEKNVNILNKYDINLDIVSDNVNILSDPELEEKIEKILETGKTKDDIYFNPSVIKKYDLKGLEDAINLLKENGLDPKKVPLMAF